MLGSRISRLYFPKVKDLLDFVGIKDVLSLAGIKDLLSFVGIKDLPPFTFLGSSISYILLELRMYSALLE